MNLEKISNRYEKIFSDILQTRILKFIDDNLFSVISDKNFTHLYKDEGNPTDPSGVHPIFDITDFSFCIVALIIDELENEEFIESHNLNTNPIIYSIFFNWLRLYLMQRHLLFKIRKVNPETGEAIGFAFYTIMKIDYTKMVNDYYDKTI